MNIFVKNIDNNNYFTVTYFIRSKTNLREAVWNLAIGQSVGNPNVRNKWETDELFENHSCKILHDEEELLNKNSGYINIAFPCINIDFDTDGVTQLLVQIMGGQLDIDIIEQCAIIDIQFPQEVISKFKGPKFGITGIRDFLGIDNKPLLGGIVKPKIGVNSDILLDMVKEMVDNGVNFIKEDEIMSNPACCPLKERLPKLSKYLNNKKVIYAVCINSDYPHVINRVKMVHEEGINGVHINFWNGLGVYKSIRELDLPVFVHFQKSGDKILTNHFHDYRINWVVICKLAAMMGVDFIHSGMWGGYMNQEETELKTVLKVLIDGNVMPALSCGMHPGLVETITNKFGIEYMANVGGALHGHPGGTGAGVRAMRQAIDKTFDLEYQQAIDKWGKNE